MTIRITPSILNADFAKLDEEIARVASASDLIHLDIMDNIFVPNFTFEFERAAEIIKSCPIPVDSHLMVVEPENTAPAFAEMGSASVTYHFEAATEHRNIIRDVHGNGARVGIALKPGTPIDVISDYIGEIDMILVMTVEPGFGGQSFMSEMLEKVRAARSALGKNDRGVWLQVDGGISPSTIASAAEAGADTFVAGSAVYKAEDPAAMVTLLRQIATQ
ncbi:MAG: ribulose-phosphate 3-epimerase [Actinobacteria bacterium]|nr:ribulose-phosphate 3-epimerase [Actinomycetota bacterium]